MTRRAERIINVLSVAAMLALVTSALLYVDGTTLLTWPLHIIPLFVTFAAFMVLTVFQVKVAYQFERAPFYIPVPFRWVMAVWFLSLTLVVGWRIGWRVLGYWQDTIVDDVVIWYQLALASVWFINRFLRIPRNFGNIVVHPGTETGARATQAHVIVTEHDGTTHELVGASANVHTEPRTDDVTVSQDKIRAEQSETSAIQSRRGLKLSEDLSDFEDERRDFRKERTDADV